MVNQPLPAKRCIVRQSVETISFYHASRVSISRQFFRWSLLYSAGRNLLYPMTRLFRWYLRVFTGERPRRRNVSTRASFAGASSLHDHYSYYSPPSAWTRDTDRYVAILDVSRASGLP